MMFFILGSHPELSRAEIESVLGEACPPSQEKVLFVDTASQNASELQAKLAGTIKTGYVIGETSGYHRPQFAELVSAVAKDAAGKNKISFGISIYDLGSKKTAQRIAQDRNQLGKEIKQLLKETGRPVRYVSSKEQELSSVIVEENGLLESGGECCLFVERDRIVVGQTAAVQDFKAWSARDYGRPARDSKSGMLPPKLARMMVNLAHVDTNGTLLDPFCGSGTILMEASLLGLKHVIGSDISEKAIEDTKQNLEWLEIRCDRLFVSPAESLDTFVIEPVDAIVTETYLGKPRAKPATEIEIKKTTQELMQIYESSFQTLHTLLKQEGTAVVAFPAFVMTDGSLYHLPLKPMLERLGWNIIDTFLYRRPDQFVAREIFRLRP